MVGAGTLAILLAVFNGQPFLREQLASIAAQDLPDWRLIASDDGSSDGSGAVLDEFSATRPAGQVVRMHGPGRGSTANFLSLLGAVPDDAPRAAFCDQDDAWLPFKLSRASAALDALPDPGRPALYFSRTLVCGPGLEHPRPSRPVPRAPGFRNALVQNVVAGNTAVMNRPAIALLRAALPAAAGTIVHDWWVYQLLSGAGAAIVYDPEPTLLYRQHAGNQIGGHARTLARLARLGRGRRAAWLDANMAALLPVADLLTAENRAVLTGFAALRAMPPGPRRLAGLRRLGLYCQRPAEQLALNAAALAGRL